MVLLIIAAVVVVGWIAWAAYYFPKKRKEAFIKTADRLGLELVFDLPSQDWDRLSKFEIYKKNSKSRRVKFAIVAETELTRITVFEYSYVVDSGESSSSRISVVKLVRDPRLQIPPLSLSRKTWASALAKLVGLQFIEFPEDQEFNSRYLIRGESEEDVRRFLDERRRKALLELPLVALEGGSDQFIAIHPDLWLQPSEIEGRFAESLAILKAFL